MTKVGRWEIKMSVNMPQKIASAAAGLDEICGCAYKSLPYILAHSKSLTGLIMQYWQNRRY